MNYRLKILIALISPIFLANCATSRAYNRGHQAELARDYETAMEEFRIAYERDPKNVDYRLKYEQSRFAAAFAHFENGRRALEKTDVETAKAEFGRTLEIDPTHALAKQELDRLNAIPANPSANQPPPQLNFMQLRETTRTDPSVQSQLEPTLTGKIPQMQMNQDSRVAFETLAQMAGLNVIFDTDFRGTRITIELTDVDIYEALDILSLQTRSFWKPVNKNTIVVSPDNQTKRREYEEHILKTIYLTNSVTSTEITEAITAIRTLLNMRYVAQSSAMNAIILRDTPDRIAIAEKIIEDIDKGKPEILVDAVVMEVDRNSLRELGILPPGGTTLSYGTQAAAAAGSTAASVVNSLVNLRDLDGINSGSFSIAIPETVAKALASNSHTNLIQNPSVRATDGKLASIRIGSKVPVPSGSFQPAFVGATGTPVVQFQYVDVGVNLDITPRVLLNREVSINVSVQVSDLAGERNVGGVILPVFSNRSVAHEIRLNEGETNILGGIITNTQTSTISGIPGLNQIPILKYLFGQERKTSNETEIVILLTPHILRMPNISDTNLRGLRIGAETKERITPNVVAAPIASETVPAAPIPAAAQPAPAQPRIAAAVDATTTPSVAPGASATSTADTAVTFSPMPITLTPGRPTAVNIDLTGTDLFGVDLTFAVDPAAVKIREVRDGGLLSQDGQIIAVVQKVEAETGTAHVSLDRPPGARPISGKGSLLTLVLEPGNRKGDTTLRLVDIRVRNAQQGAKVGRPAEVRVSVP